MNVKNNNIIVKNKNASRNYHLGDKYQAGLVLEGWEVKGLRNGKVDVKDSYVTLRNNEAWVIRLKIDAPASLKNENIDSTRSRKLLLNKKEIHQIKKKVTEKKFSLIPIKLFINQRGFAKIEIGLGKGKKEFDKREDIKQRDISRKIREDL